MNVYIVFLGEYENRYAFKVFRTFEAAKAAALSRYDDPSEIKKVSDGYWVMEGRECEIEEHALA